MIEIHIISAKNLPVPTQKERKTKIFCFSSSSCHYFYNSFKNNSDTKNPIWDCKFDVDLFRCSVLTFKLYSSRMLSKDIFLGTVDINIFHFLTNSPGKEILKSPYQLVNCEFPLSSCKSPNAVLNLSFMYSPKIYRFIQVNKISKPLIHVWTTFTPSPPNIENIVEIELLQVCPYKDNNDAFYYYFNKFHPWESIGSSSLSNTILGQTGYTQIHTLYTDRINGKYNFFILKVSNYSGVVTLNFVSEKHGRQKNIKNKMFITPKANNTAIGTIKTIDVVVEPYKKYCCPFYFFYDKKFFSENFEFNSFPLIEAQIQKSDAVLDFSDFINNEAPFHSNIIESTKSHIQNLNGFNFFETFVLPNTEKVSLQKVFQKFNLQFNSKIRIYINGSTTRSNGTSAYTHFWKPDLIIYDKSTSQRCPEVSKLLLKKPNCQSPILFKKDIHGHEWHTFVDLDLNEIGIDITIVFTVHCQSPLESANPPGMIFITHIEGDNETILFRNSIYTDSYNIYYASIFRLEFIEDDWYIISMRNCCNKKKQLDFVLDTLCKSRFMMTQSLNEKINEEFYSDSSHDEEILLEEINFLY